MALPGDWEDSPFQNIKRLVESFNIKGLNVGENPLRGNIKSRKPFQLHDFGDGACNETVKIKRKG